MKILAPVSMAALLLFSCQSHTQPDRLSCGYPDDPRNWQTLDAPPQNADALRQFAKANDFGNDVDYSKEAWFGLTTGEIMLCLYNGGYDPNRRRMSLIANEWWVFDLSTNDPTIIEHDGLIWVD